MMNKELQVKFQFESILYITIIYNIGLKKLVRIAFSNLQMATRRIFVHTHREVFERRRFVVESC